MKKIIFLSFISVLLLLPSSVQGQSVLVPEVEYLFPISYGADVAQNDVIGLRVYQNLDNKDPLTWYQDNVSNPKNTLPEIKVDGYTAVRDDRTVYIQASNLVNLTTTRDFFTNIYVLAYNQNASQETVEIFNQMLANMKFNKNVMGFYCLKTQYEAVKDSLRRDTIRKADLYKLDRLLRSSTGLNLSAGTYVPNMSISTWPSWQATLGQQLGSALPIDPLNVMVDQLISCTANEQCSLAGQCSGGYCSACPTGFDPRTCWNERELKYHDIDGFVYQYNLGVLTIRYEYPQLVFPLETGCWLGCNQGGNYYVLGSCLPLPDNRYCATSGWIDNVCGDNIIRCNEVCEGDNCKAGCLSCVENYHAEGSLCEADTVSQAVLLQTLSTAEEIRWTGSGWSAPYATACVANAILDGVGICHCKTNYHEEETAGVFSCVADTRWFVCESTNKPPDTVWNTVDSYAQNWDGQKWVPLDSLTTHNDMPTTSACHFKCNDFFTYTDECVANDCKGTPASNATATMCPDDAVGVPDDTYFSLVPTFEDCTATKCQKYCNSGYVILGTNCVLAPPSNLQAVTASNSEINLSWDYISGSEDGFNIEFKTETGEWSEKGRVDAGVTTYKVETLQPDTIYYFQVRAYTAGENSVYSNIAFAKTFSEPLAPSALSASRYGDNIRLTWTDNSFDPNNEAGFKLERKLRDGSYDTSYPIDADETFYVDINGLISGTKYCYRVSAIESTGNSMGFSNEVCYTAPATSLVSQAPSPPINFTATPKSSTQIYLYWQDPASYNDLDRAETFLIERKIGASGTYAQIFNNMSSLLNDTGLATGTLYIYRIKALNTAGDSDWVETSATTDLYPDSLPSAPTNLILDDPIAIFGVMYYPILHWTDNSSNEQGFSLWRKIGTATTFTEFSPGSLLADVTSIGDYLDPNTAYSYKVRAYNQVGTSAYTSELSGITGPTPTAPTAPASLTAALFETNITLNWTDTSDNETGFIIERHVQGVGDDFSVFVSVVADIETFTDNSPKESNKYYRYRVRAKNDTGNSGYSNEACVAFGTAICPSPYITEIVPPKHFAFWDATFKSAYQWLASRSGLKNGIKNIADKVRDSGIWVNLAQLATHEAKAK